MSLTPLSFSSEMFATPIMRHRWCPSLRPLKLLGSKEERKQIMQKHMMPAINDPSAARTWDVVVTSYEGVSEKACLVTLAEKVSCAP